MSERAAIYARVSTDVQRDNYSIPSQVQECLNYVKQRGYSLVGDQFVDPDTGKDVDKSPRAVAAFVDDFTSRELSRPSLNAALDYLKRLGFDVLIVHALDRLARDPYYRQSIEHMMEDGGARVEYVLGGYDETAEGEVRKDLDATFAKWENAKRTERTTRGRKRKAESGRYTAGIIPFGYRADPSSESGLMAYEPEAKVVRSIFQLFVGKRLSLHEATRELSSRGVKTHHQNTVWAVATVSNILHNTAYDGYVFYNRSKKQGRRRVMRPEAEWIRVNIPRLIDPDTFAVAQELLQHNQQYRRQHPKRFYLLAGMVICSECRRAYVTQTRNRGKDGQPMNYTMYRHRMKNGHCSNHTLTGNFLEGLVWGRIREVLLHPEALREGYERGVEAEKKKQAGQIKLLETIETSIDKLKQKKARLNAIYADPDVGMTKEEYLEQRSTLDGAMSAATTQAEQVASQMRHIPTPEEFKSLERFAAKVQSALTNDHIITREAKRQIMLALNLKVLVAPNGCVRLEGWLAPEHEGLLSRPSCNRRRRRG